MRTFENPAEFAAAAVGQLGGGLPTPESLVGIGAKGGTWLARLLKAGLQQGAVTAATDPAVQALNIRAGVQDEYDPRRTAAAGATGFVTGAGIKSAAEALGGGVPRHAPAAVPADDARLHENMVDARSDLRPGEAPVGQTEPNSGAMLGVETQTLPALKENLRAAYVKAASGKIEGRDRVVIGHVTPEGAARLNRLFQESGIKLDVTGYQHLADAHAARHVNKHHGTAATETPRGQVPVTAEDWGMIPDILAAPDSISTSKKAGGLPAIVYAKRVNGHVIYVEEVRAGRRALAATTMYKKKIRPQQ
jgi:hypothetical protein